MSGARRVGVIGAAIPVVYTLILHLLKNIRNEFEAQ
jgi:hypothetical protein